MENIIPINRIATLLNLNINPNRQTADSFSCVCPFCGRPNEKKYKLNICISKETYHCFRCGAAGGKLDLFSRVYHGVPAVKGENTKALYKELLEMLGKDSTASAVHPVANMVSDISPASDDILNRVFRTLLSLPYLRLNAEHTEKLQQRGLINDEIALHGYASLSYDVFTKLDLHNQKSFLSSSEAKNALTEIGSISEKELLPGLKIADDLLRKGLDLNGVPGFFKIADHWCMRITFGMLIPTINLNGQIVGIQTRRNGSSGTRYLTLSAKGFPNGVTRSIARTHIVKDDIELHTLVFLTEGPLKADVIYHLLHRRGFQNVCVIALQGVNSINELSSICGSLAKKGVTEIHEVFDMDKVTNVNVEKALANAAKIIEENSLRLRRHYWDAKYGQIRLEELRSCLSDRVVCTDEHSLWQTIQNISRSLNASGIAFNGKWKPETKGFDDYLNHISQGGF